MSSAADTSAAVEAGLYVLASVRPRDVIIRTVRRVARAPRHLLRAPRLNLETPLLARPLSELVLDVISETGSVVESFAWMPQTEVFVERIDPRGEMAGAPVVESAWDARFWIPAGPDTRALRFYQTSWSNAERLDMVYLPLAMVDFRQGQPWMTPPPFPVPWTIPPMSIPLPPVAALPSVLGHDEPILPLPGGFIKSRRTVQSSGPSNRRFDIVVLGDGFKEHELPFFEIYADRLITAILTTPPYSAYANRINVHIVQVVSTESGISNCPGAGMPRLTYFGAGGFFNGTPSGTYIGVPDVQVVMNAVDTVIPQEQANLIMMIVNCTSERGGSAPFELGMAFVTRIDDPVIFANVVVHEAAHVVGRVCEEYNPCAPRVLGRVYPNETTKDEVDAGTTSWKSLAHENELLETGRFRAVHRVDDPMDIKCQPVMEPPELAAMLGAFWGCHNGISPATPYCDARGAEYDRPMAQCKMRRLTYDFCRVCSALIARTIEAAAPND